MRPFAILIFPTAKECCSWRGVEQGLARWAHNPKAGGSNPSPAIFSFGGIAQLVEQRNHNPSVVGSNPAAATSFLFFYIIFHVNFLSLKIFTYLRLTNLKLRLANALCEFSQGKLRISTGKKLLKSQRLIISIQIYKWPKSWLKIDLATKLTIKSLICDRWIPRLWRKSTP